MCRLRLEMHTYLNIQHAWLLWWAAAGLCWLEMGKFSLEGAAFSPAVAPPPPRPPPPLLFPSFSNAGTAQAVYTHKTAIFSEDGLLTKKVTLSRQPPRDPLPFLGLPLRIYSTRLALSCIPHSRGCFRDAANRDQYSRLPPPLPCNWSNGSKMKDAVGSLNCLLGFAGVRMRFNGSAHQMLSDPCEWLHPGARSEEINPLMSSSLNFSHGNWKKYIRIPYFNVRDL